MAGVTRIPRTRGAVSGVLLILLGAWGGLAPFVGPYFRFAYTPDKAWAYTSGRLWLSVVPGAAALLGGLLVTIASHRAVGCVGAFAAALGAPELARRPEFAENTARSANRVLLIAVIEELLAADTCARWLARLEAAKVPCAPVNDIGQAMTDAQTQARRMRITAGGLELPGQVVKMAGCPDPLERPAAPELDEHGDAIRAEFGL